MAMMEMKIMNNQARKQVELASHAKYRSTHNGMWSEMLIC